MSKHSVKVIAALIVFTVFAFYAIYSGINADTCACVMALVLLGGVCNAFKDELEEWQRGERR